MRRVISIYVQCRSLFWSKFCWLLLYYGRRTAASGSMELLLIPLAQVDEFSFMLVPSGVLDAS